MRATMLLLCTLSALAAACGDPMSFEPGKVDLEALPHANAGCEAPTSAQLATGASMLTGRACMDCHRAESEATSTFTAAGTIYGSAKGACGEAGIEGVLVEILDTNGDVQTTTTTNAAGNFFTSAPIELPMRVRLSKDDKTAVMTSTVEIASCATCHQSEPEAGAPGRIYLE